MDEIEKKIFKALQHKKYKARTIQGIAKEMHIEPTIVVSKLNSSPELNKSVKIYPRKSKDGRILITTRQSFDSQASIRDKFIDAFATNRVKIKNEY